MFIKYRVWDRKEQKFIFPINELKLDNNDNLLEVNGVKNEYINRFDKRFELMRSSTCSDITGKEIFERDIILIIANNPPDYLEVGTVRFEKGSFVVDDIALKELVEIHSCQLKIIGNSWEGVSIDINNGYKYTANELRQKIKNYLEKYEHPPKNN